MLRCQFLCHVLKALFFIKIALKLSYFCKRMQNFRALGAPPPDPRASGGWGLRLHTLLKSLKVIFPAFQLVTEDPILNLCLCICV